MAISTSKKEVPKEIKWEANSHIPHNRSSSWYLIFGLVALGLIVFAIYTHSITTTITFVAIILTIMALASQKPKTITHKLTRSEIITGKNIYPYKIIKTFWINYNPPLTKTISFETTAYLNNKVTLQLGDQDPVTVKLFLSQYLREDLHREETFTETIARQLKI